jgi:hypothetical protein
MPSSQCFSGNILNVTIHRVLLDKIITFGGFHYNDPRMFCAELRHQSISKGSNRNTCNAKPINSL